MTKTTTIKYFNETELNEFIKALEKVTLYESVIKGKDNVAYKRAVRNEAIFKLMYYCAFRVSEVTNLKVGQYNEARKQIYCERLKGGNNNTLQIYDDNIVTSLTRHLEVNCPKKYLFEHVQEDSNLSLSRSTLDVIIKRYCKIAQLKDKRKFHCHVLRHTRAIALAEQGLDLKELQFWLGHSDVSNTLIYFQFTIRQQEELYRKIQINESIYKIG